MPEIAVVYYADKTGEAPALEWLATQPAKVQDKFEFVIEQLEQKIEKEKGKNFDLNQEKELAIKEKESLQIRGVILVEDNNSLKLENRTLRTKRNQKSFMKNFLSRK